MLDAGSWMLDTVSLYRFILLPRLDSQLLTISEEPSGALSAVTRARRK